MSDMYGGNIGCIKHFSISAKVSFGSSSEPIIQALNDNGIIPINQIIPKQIIGNTKIFVNGNWIGIHKDAHALVNKMRISRIGQFDSTLVNRPRIIAFLLDWMT